MPVVFDQVIANVVSESATPESVIITQPQPEPDTQKLYRLLSYKELRAARLRAD